MSVLFPLAATRVRSNMNVKYAVSSGCHQGEILAVVEQLALSPSQVCGLLFGGTCAQVYNPFNHWNVSLPNTIKPPVSPHKPPKVSPLTICATSFTPLSKIAVLYYPYLKLHSSINT